MPTVLSLHLGATAVHAAVSVDGRIDVLALGGGTVATAAPDPTDGRSLVRLLVDAHARCLRVLDAVPDELVLVRPDGANAVDPVLAEAARRARVPEPVILEESRAVAALAAHGPAGVAGDLMAALGGIFWHRSGDAPTGPKLIVTRADLGGESVGVDRRPPAPSVVAVGPRTVFKESVVPARRRGLPTPVLAVVAVLVLAALAALLLFGSDDQPIAPAPVTVVTTASPATPAIPSTTAAPSTTQVSTTTSASATTSAPTTTEPEADGQVTTEAPASDPSADAGDPAAGELITDTGDTSTTASTSVIPSSSPPPTTIAPSLGRVTLSGVGLTVDAASFDETLVAFGDPSDGVVAELSRGMGEAVGDTGWAADLSCAAAEVRRLFWSGLEVVLVRDVPDDVGRFVQWYLSGRDSSETSLWTLERIGIGSTVKDLQSAHPALLLSQPDERDPAGRFDTEPVLGDGISGAVHSTADSGRVLMMWAGNACSRWTG